MPPQVACLSLLSAAFALAGCAARDASRATPVGRATPGRPPVTVADLDERPVIGRLGVPLGTVVEVEAVVISGDDLRMKRFASRYLLRVTRAAGRPLPEAPVMEFSVPSFVDVPLAGDPFDLYELKTGEKADTLDSNQTAELERGYVGKAVRLAAYEVGGFSGVPDNMPDDVPTWAGVGFGFSSSLVVLAERK